MPGDTDMHLLVTDTFLKKIGAWIRKPVNLSLMQRDTSPSCRVDQAVDCGLWNVVPLLQWLCEVDGYWRELEHAVVHVDPEKSKHAQWMTCLVSMQAKN